MPDNLTPDELVRREVHYCCSALVSTMAAAAYLVDAQVTPQQGGKFPQALRDLESVCEQAAELAAPIDDWEEAAIQAGWIHDGAWHGYNHDEYPNWLAAQTNGECNSHDTAQEACEANDIEPNQREVYEHWIVSDWLADKLEARGEKVDRDFAGMTVWARTTTGQTIACDSVIESICADLPGEIKAALAAIDGGAK